MVVTQSDILPAKRPCKGYMEGQGVLQKEMNDDDAVTGSFLSSVMQIEPQWIDYNGHLNMAYYNVMFDRAIDEYGCSSASDYKGATARPSPPNATCVFARNSSRRSRAGFGPDPGWRRRKAAAHLRGIAPRHRRLALRHLGKHDHSYRHGRAKDRAVSARHSRPHRGGGETHAPSRGPRASDARSRCPRNSTPVRRGCARAPGRPRPRSGTARRR